MPTLAVDQPPSPRRLALPLTTGLALWAFAHCLLALPGAYDTDGIQTSALATQWVISTAGAVLALACTYRLARRLEDHLTSRVGTSELQQPPQPEASSQRRRSAAPVLVAVGAAAAALSDLLWVFAGPLPSWAFAVVDLAGTVVAPVALTLGMYLALRRLEDHLAGHHRGGAPKAPDAVGERHASGLSSPYVANQIIGHVAGGVARRSG